MGIEKIARVHTRRPSSRWLVAGNHGRDGCGTKNQKARSVISRRWPGGPSAGSDRYCGNLAPGLGPPRSAQRGSIACRRLSHRRMDRDMRAAIARPMGRCSGFPTGRPWDFAGDRLASIEGPIPVPGPAPRIGPAGQKWPFLSRHCPRGPGSDASSRGGDCPHGPMHHRRRR